MRALVLFLCLLAAGAVAAFGFAGSASRPSEARAAGARQRPRRGLRDPRRRGRRSRARASRPSSSSSTAPGWRGARGGLRGVLRGGGNAPEAVKAAIVTLEDNPLFNAGKGAVFTTDGKHELDASIMDGETLDTGAVTGVEHIKNPILLAARSAWSRGTCSSPARARSCSRPTRASSW